VSAPVNLVNLEAVTKTFGTTTLLDAVSLGVAEGERIGIVGRNGGGKSTLVRILSGAEPADSGRVTHARGLRLGMLSQHDALDPSATVRHVVVGDRADHEWAADARTREVVTALLGGGHVLDRQVGPMSGGERRRVALARLLLDDLDLLILDEPTNHLDIETIDWLARYLQGQRVSLVVVTHDRWFLDEVCTRTWEVEGATVNAYDGGYSAYVLAKAERARIAAADEARRQNLLRKELAWLRRGPPARTSKPRFRIEAANALIADEPPPRDSVELMRFATARLGRSVYDVEDATVSLGGRALLEHVTWRLGPGDRVGLVGVNGSGKTTLLRLLLGSVAASGGRVLVGKTVRVAYLSQEVTELDPELRVLTAVQEVRQSVDLGKGRQLTASQLLDRFGFTGDAQWKRIGDLSGGERRRLQLLRLLMDEPNVLLLDEPTNDLDIDTLNQLEDVLDGWPGTLVVVSHDRFFLERVTDHVVALLGGGSLRMLVRGVEEYLERRQAGGEPVREAPAKERAGDTRAARKELARLDRQLEKLGAREAALHEQMAEAATDYERIAALDEELRALLAEKASVEEAWLIAAEEAG
jgi:ATP-binding cassette subfamily F protein uup